MLSIVLFVGGHPTLGSVAVIKLCKEKKAMWGGKGYFIPELPGRYPSLRELGGIHVKDLEAETKEEAWEMLLIDLFPGLLSDFSTV